MPIEQRVMSTPKRSIGGIREGRAPVAVEEPEAKKSRKPSKRTVIILVAALLVVGGGAGYVFVLKPAGGSVAAVAPAPKPGTVLTVDAVSVNLAGGHYLRLGLGLQLTADVTEAPDPAKALDLAITLFSGRTVAEVSAPKTRDRLKAELAASLSKAYDGEVMDVFLTDYVTQ